MIETFVKSRLRRILDLWWPEIISSERLCQSTCQMPVEQEILKRRWRWIGHTLHKLVGTITRQALALNPEEKRKRERPRTTWRHDLQADIKEMGYSWRQLDKLAQDRNARRNHAGGLYPKRGNEGYD